MVAFFAALRIDIAAPLADRARMHIALRAIVLLAAIFALAGCGRHAVRPASRPIYPVNGAGNANPNDILFRAISLVGTPYRYGGNTPRAGFDCSGLVDFVFRDVAGIALPRTAQEISRIDAPDVRKSRLESGDLVFFHHDGRSVGHVGIYVGNGRFVHAPNEGGTVRLDYLDAPYWREHYAGAKRVLK